MLFLETVELSESTINIIMMSVWLSVFVLALIVELSTQSLTSVWFCGGAVAALIFTYIPNVPFFVEIIVFFVVSIVLLVSLRPLSKKILLKNQKEERMNVDAIVGKKGVILKEIKELDAGEVRIDSVIWSCLSEDGSEIEKEERVVVTKIIGNRLYVKKEEKEGN